MTNGQKGPADGPATDAGGKAGREGASPRSDQGKNAEMLESDDESGGGEDDASTEKNGDDSHLHDDQKSRTLKN